MKISTVQYASLMLFFANQNSLPEEQGCKSNSDCKDGEICHWPWRQQGGKCVPGCKRDEDCTEEQNCQDGSCGELCVVDQDGKFHLGGTCGTNALCKSTKHKEECSCPPNHLGNPEVECIPDEKGKGRVAENDPTIRSQNPGIACPIPMYKMYKYIQ